MTKTVSKKTTSKEKSTFGKDRRRKHHHWLVTVFYADGEKFGRVYTDKDKATRKFDTRSSIFEAGNDAVLVGAVSACYKSVAVKRP